MAARHSEQKYPRSSKNSGWPLILSTRRLKLLCKTLFANPYICTTRSIPFSPRSVRKNSRCPLILATQRLKLICSTLLAEQCICRNQAYTVQALHTCYAGTVQAPCNYCANTVQLPCRHRAGTVPALYRSETHGWIPRGGPPRRTVFNFCILLFVTKF